MLAAHILTVGEMPAHSHTATVDTTAAHTHQYKYTNGFANPSSAGSLTRQEWLRPVETIDTSASGAHSHSVNISNAGNNQQHNNIQPYIVATLWKRIA